MKKNLRKYQEKILQALSDKIDDFYLAGGTALSLFYFKHRESLDLDFFTQDFDSTRVSRIIDGLRKRIRKEIVLLAQSLEKKKAKVMVYNIEFARTRFLKIDFVEDLFDLLKTLKRIEGINVLSLEDIYLRKIFTITGRIPQIDLIGTKKFVGGRQEAKDFYDLYYLSHTFMNLSKFVSRYNIEPAIREALIVWYRTYNRMDIKTGLTELITDREINYVAMERHFKKEIDRLIEEELKGI